MLVMKPDALRAGISASDAARTLGVAPAMAKEHLLSAESKGMLLDHISSIFLDFSYITGFRLLRLWEKKEEYLNLRKTEVLTYKFVTRLLTIGFCNINKGYIAFFLNFSRWASWDNKSVSTSLIKIGSSLLLINAIVDSSSSQNSSIMSKGSLLHTSSPMAVSA